jgi:hypothetical protein
MLLLDLIILSFKNLDLLSKLGDLLLLGVFFNLGISNLILKFIKPDL